MTEAETKRLMERYGITATSRGEYRYDGYKYDNLADAVGSAERATSRAAMKAGRDQRARRA